MQTRTSSALTANTIVTAPHNLESTVVGTADCAATKVLSEYRAPAPGWLTRFMWWCAGADEQVLALCPRSEHYTYAGIGGFVAVTSVIAFLTSSYALSIVLRPRDGANETFAELLAIGFGLFWGAAIFNLDRYIVSSSGKGDGRETISLSELTNAVPRIALAVIIGVVMSAPLELRIFEPEINAEMLRIKSQKEAEARAALEGTVGADLARTIRAQSMLEARVDTVRIRVTIAEAAATAELDGTGGSRSRNVGPIYRRKLGVAESARAELQSIERQLAPEKLRLEAERIRIEGERAEATRRAQATAEGMDGLIARLRVLHEVGGATPIFIGILLILFEVTPVLSKLMHKIGPYDLLQEQLALITTSRVGIHEETVEGVRNGRIIRRSTDKFPLAEAIRRRAARSFEPQEATAP